MVDIRALASGSGGNCYYITDTDGSSPLLLDPGIKYRHIQQGIGFGISELTCSLVTHEHMDHAKAVPELIKAGVDCFMSPGTAEMLAIDNHRIHTVGPLQQHKVGPWTILPFEVQHDAKQPYGFLLQNGGKKLIYCTDT